MNEDLHTDDVSFSDVCSNGAEVKPQEEEEEKEDNSFSENGTQGAEGVMDPRTCTHTLTYIKIFISA